jgi:hypothetical protein
MHSVRRIVAVTGSFAIGVYASGGLPVVCQAPSASPPLYQRMHYPRARAGAGTSLIAGVGDLTHPPEPLPAQSPRSLKFEPACAQKPDPKALHDFGVFQWITRQQASALDLATSSTDNPVDNSASRDVLVWRAGKMAECDSTDGKSLVVYGAEWDVALFVDERGMGRNPMSFVALSHQVPARRILAVACSTAGFEKDAPFPASLRTLASHFDTSAARLTDQFLADFAVAVRQGDSATKQVTTFGPIGYVER